MRSTAKVIDFKDYINKEQSHITKTNEIFNISLTDGTRSDYTREIKKFFKVGSLSQLQYKDVIKISSSDILKYLKVYVDNDKSKSYVNKIRSALSKYYRVLKNYSDEHQLNLITINPADQDYIKDYINSATNNDVSDFDIENIQVLDKTIIQDYIKAIEENEFDPKMKHRNILSLRIMTNSGIRRSELCNLKIENCIAHDNGEEIIHFIKVIKGKGNKTRLVDIYKNLYNSIIEYDDRFGLDQDSYVIGNGMFNKKLSPASINNIMKKYDKYVTTKIAPHDNRRICAIENMKAGNDIASVQQIMGHSSRKTTELYLRKSGLNIQKKNMMDI